MQNGIKVGFGYDVHQLADGIPFMLGGIEVPFEKGPVAHSDGDVLIHALCDALLGAAGMGDIGLHFPDSSDEFEGIDSKELLARVVKLLTNAGYAIGNIDATVSLEKPKLRPHINAMKETLAAILKIEEALVNVKATTTEKLGFVGRQEGVAAQVIVLIYTL